jgi:LCP family protein required for cell wall assembly
MPSPDDRGEPERPDYKVYRSRPGLLSRLRTPDLGSLRKKTSKEPRGPGRERPEPGGPRPPWRRILKWVGIAALVWLAISFLAFAISAQIQKGKLTDMGDTLHGNLFLAASPQTILVLGTDVRPSGLASQSEASSEKCIEAAGEGKPPPTSCPPYRSDTIMLLRAGGGAFEKLSIPRDTLANIPGIGEDKINSAYAHGGAKLTAQTVEDFLGINVDQVAIVDFTGFRDFIDSIGGVKVNLDKKICSDISGGKFQGGLSLRLPRGESTLDGNEALSLARTRENNGPATDHGPCANAPPLSDIDRVKFQQDILAGIKGRLTSPWRLPYNFIKGPWIGWNAPKAIVSSMGAWTMPQLVFAAGIGGGGGTDVLKPSGTSAAGNLIVPPSECERALKQFLGHAPDKTPTCSPPS